MSFSGYEIKHCESSGYKKSADICDVSGTMFCPQITLMSADHWRFNTKIITCKSKS